MSTALLTLLKQRFGDAVFEIHQQFGDDTAVLDPTAWFDAARFLRTDPRCAMNQLVDLAAVDYPDREPRFELVLHLRSIEKGHRLRLKARIGDEGDQPEIDSLVPIWSGANWLERETYDMFGIVFRGHPDLRRILMYPEFKGHPLRKDYPANHIQPLVEFRQGTTDKLRPFHADEGMSFGRQTHTFHRDDPVMVASRAEDEPEKPKPLKLPEAKKKPALPPPTKGTKTASKSAGKE
ncbi:MAG: NADH-quinone oxidoreductase subunit C [Polyangiaceae bacterium]